MTAARPSLLPESPLPQGARFRPPLPQGERLLPPLPQGEGWGEGPRPGEAIPIPDPATPSPRKERGQGVR
jgi:hypothetical protein